jgi:hypothetical protein
LIDETSVATCRRPIQNVQECGSWGLLFVGHIAVPGYAVRALLEVIFGGCVCGGPVHQVDFWEALGCAGGWVDV